MTKENYLLSTFVCKLTHYPTKTLRYLMKLSTYSLYRQQGWLSFLHIRAHSYHIVCLLPAINLMHWALTARINSNQLAGLGWSLLD